jgi:hypothetical protein
MHRISIETSEFEDCSLTGHGVFFRSIDAADTTTNAQVFLRDARV